MSEEEKEVAAYLDGVVRERARMLLSLLEEPHTLDEQIYSDLLELLVKRGVAHCRLN